MTDHEAAEAVAASVAIIREHMHEMQRECVALGQAMRDSSITRAAWAELAAWQMHAELSLHETLVKIGVFPRGMEGYGAYLGCLAKAMTSLRGDTAGHRFRARWDQVQAAGIALEAREAAS